MIQIRKGKAPPAAKDLSWLIETISQALKFGVVGGAATAAHVVAFVAWIEVAGMKPLLANVTAFSIAVGVSFLGHFQWTFRTGDVADDRPWGRPLVKFIVLALFGFGLNSLAVFIVVDLLAMPYTCAVVPMITVVPASIFVFSKFWAFA